MQCYNVTLWGGLRVTGAQPTLSICTTCRDGLEARLETRGGVRLAAHVVEEHARRPEIPMKLRGIRCMSQCKRSCIVSLGAPGKFTYVFGDLDPADKTHVAALFELVEKYTKSVDGFLDRRERPDILQASILGRFPPLESQSHLVSDLQAKAS
ncbi:DUF1636 domain-containing protein [Cognatiyoonia sp. IB215182]|uniref:DUF1636 domain-containing protein n=1 Tax=Cognatiyoonia sp. IB215182 TaxID=3097353 RepID=UPI002A104513|nr:DUF1636 domain-containing protein [Cognatiyoonia sp. IB215182]MDX8355731.1 DUF1636 domain-containing protein [Cognatiyoonia sp. IB215182]